MLTQASAVAAAAGSKPGARSQAGAPSPKKDKRAPAVRADASGIYFSPQDDDAKDSSTGAAEQSEQADPLAMYRAAAAAATKALTNTDRSSPGSDQRPTNKSFDSILRRIFRAMDTDFDGVVRFDEVTAMIAAAHASGSSSRVATDRIGSASKRGLASTRIRPQGSVALDLPSEFDLEVFLREMGRLAGSMDTASFESHVLGLFECFRDDLSHAVETGCGSGAASSTTIDATVSSHRPVLGGISAATPPSDAVVSASQTPVYSFLDSIVSVAAHSDIRAAGVFPCVCTAWRDAVEAHSSQYWRMLAVRLSSSCLLYLHDNSVCPSTAGWRSQFLHLWAQRRTWQGGHDDASKSASSQAFQVSVAVRFRPAVANAGGEDTERDGEEVVVIPLHQKVAMVRAKRGCSHGQAMRIVMRQEQQAKDRRAGKRGMMGGLAGTGGASANADGCSVAAAQQASSTYRERQSAAQDAAAAAYVAAKSAEGINPLGRAKNEQAVARVEQTNSISEGTKDTAAKTEASEVFVTAFQGMPAAATEAMIIRFFDKVFKRSRPMKRHGRTPRADASASEGHPIKAVKLLPAANGFVDGFLEFHADSEAAAAVNMNGCDAYGDAFGDCAVKVFRSTPEHLEMCVQGGRALDRSEADLLVKDAELTRLTNLHAVREARQKEKEQQKADAEALRAVNEEHARQRRAKERAAERAAKLAAEANKTEEEKEEDQQRAREEAAHQGKASIISINPEKTQVLAMAPSVGLRPFTFARVFEPDSQQEDVYDRCGRAAVADLLNGQSGCVIVYGQTGSGKTHTMFGDGMDSVGLVPRVCGELMDALQERKSTVGIASKLSVAYVEIFGSEVTDLLRGGAPIGSNASTDEGGECSVDNTFHAHRWVLDGRVDVPVETVGRAMEVLAQGDKCKRRAATAMNARSSRAHALFILSLKQVRDGIEVTDKLFLADLGGSERLNKSRAADEVKSLVSVEGGDEVSRISWKEYYAARQKLQESLNINVGLFCLQKCIEALLQREAAASSGEKQVHVPYGDSKLTLLLKDALTGGARLTVLVCASLEPRNAVESIQTLRFGESCSQVETRGGRNAGAGAAALRKLVADIDDEIAAVQAIIIRDQRWEKRIETREDVIELKDNFTSKVTHDGVEDHSQGVLVVGKDDGKGGVQTITHQVERNVLVGAEEAEAKLATLLERKRQLLGE